MHDPERFATGRRRPRRAGRRRRDGVSGDARRARGPRHPAAGHLPRGERRRPHPALLGDAPPAPARERSLHAGGDRARAAPPRPDPGRGGRRPRHERPPAARASGAAVRPHRRPPAGDDDDPADQLRLQVRHPARGRPRVRHAVHPEPVLRAGAARALGPDASRSASSSSPSRAPSSTWTRSTTCSSSPSRPSRPRARAG